VRVTGFLRDENAIREELARFFKFADAAKMLAKLKIASDVVWIYFEKFLEIGGGGVVVPELRAFEREAVERERVVRFLRDELLEHFTA
jgi:hypothetical protein